MFVFYKKTAQNLDSYQRVIPPNRWRLGGITSCQAARYFSKKKSAISALNQADRQRGRSGQRRTMSGKSPVAMSRPRARRAIGPPGMRSSHCKCESAQPLGPTAEYEDALAMLDRKVEASIVVTLAGATGRGWCIRWMGRSLCKRCQDVQVDGARPWLSNSSSPCAKRPCCTRRNKPWRRPWSLGA